MCVLEIREAIATGCLSLGGGKGREDMASGQVYGAKWGGLSYVIVQKCHLETIHQRNVADLFSPYRASSAWRGLEFVDTHIVCVMLVRGYSQRCQ